MGVGLGGSPYYTPPPGSFGQGITPVGNTIWEQNLPTAYYSYGRSLGVPDDQSAFSRWFANQYGRFQQGYGAYTAQQPLTANVIDYARGLGDYGSWMRQFMNQDPRLRGLDPGARGGGPARWVMR